MAGKLVRIDALPESAWRYSGFDAIVCVDILLSSTTLVSALAQGRRVFVASTESQAAACAARVRSPELATDAVVGGGSRGFRGPAWLVQSASKKDSLVYVSPLAAMLAAAGPRASYVACLRNLEATANALALSHSRVVILAAGNDGEVCAEDQMAAAWLAARLRSRGFVLDGRGTLEEVERWTFDPSLVGLSRSAERLRARARGADVDFVVSHVDDLNVVCRYADGELTDPVARRQELEDDTPTPAWGLLLPSRHPA
jgi:phosphosulfolactate phosphohydrolase-like enzyme